MLIKLLIYVAQKNYGTFVYVSMYCTHISHLRGTMQLEIPEQGWHLPSMSCKEFTCRFASRNLMEFCRNITDMLCTLPEWLSLNNHLYKGKQIDGNPELHANKISYEVCGVFSIQIKILNGIGLNRKLRYCPFSGHKRYCVGNIRDCSI